MAATWAELQFEQKLQLVLMGTPGEMVGYDAEDMAARIGNYAGEIGDLEQTLPSLGKTMNWMNFCVKHLQ